MLTASQHINQSILSFSMNDYWRLLTAEAASLPVVTGVRAHVGQQKLFVYTLPNKDVKSLPFSWSPLNSLSVALLLTSDVFKYSRTCLLIMTIYRSAHDQQHMGNNVIADTQVNAATTLNGSTQLNSSFNIQMTNHNWRYDYIYSFIYCNLSGNFQQVLKIEKWSWT